MICFFNYVKKTKNPCKNLLLVQGPKIGIYCKFFVAESENTIFSPVESDELAHTRG